MTRPAPYSSKYGTARSLLRQLFDEQPRVFGRQLRHAVLLENPLEVRTMRSGRKESKVCFAAPFSQL